MCEQWSRRGVDGKACAAACAAGERKRMKWGGRLNVVHLLKYVGTQAEGR